MADQKPESAVAVAEAPQSAADVKLLETSHTPEVKETDQDGHLTVPVADEKDDTEQAPCPPPPAEQEGCADRRVSEGYVDQRRHLCFVLDGIS